MSELTNDALPGTRGVAGRVKCAAGGMLVFFVLDFKELINLSRNALLLSAEIFMGNSMISWSFFELVVMCQTPTTFSWVRSPLFRLRHHANSTQVILSIADSTPLSHFFCFFA